MGAFRDFIENNSPTESLPSLTPGVGSSHSSPLPIGSPQEPYSIQRLEKGFSVLDKRTQKIDFMLSQLRSRVRQIEIQFTQFKGASSNAFDDPAHVLGQSDDSAQVLGQ